MKLEVERSMNVTTNVLWLDPDLSYLPVARVESC